MKKIGAFLVILSLNFATAQKEVKLTYNEFPLTLKVDSDEIFGTLTTPSLSKKYPIALLIAGSGPIDRDGNNNRIKNNSLKMLSHALAERGIATLRYDKRGIGESKNAGKTEENLRFEFYINDVKNWINLLKKDRRFSKIIIIGHSEGSLVGMLASEKADQFISIAGAGEAADELLKNQILAQKNKQIEDLTFPIIDSLKSGNLVKKIDPMLNPLFRPSVQPYLISWFKYNPQEAIKKLNIPILVLQGTNDLQITTKDAENLSQANKNAKLSIIDKMNHIMKIIDGDKQANLASYNEENLPISEVMINQIVLFVK